MQWLVLLAVLPLASPFQITVGLPLQNLDLLDTSFWRIADPSSPDYLRFLSLDQLGNMIGAHHHTIANTSAWLIGMGGHSLTVSPLRDTVTAEFDEDGSRAEGWIPSRHPGLESDFILRRDQQSSADHPPARNQLASSARSGTLGYTVSGQKQAYGIPADLTATNESTLQMVWGPGTFGYSVSELSAFKDSQVPLLNLDKVKFDTANHGHSGDNYMEGNLDTQMISAFGLNVSTLVSNTNTSTSTEEGNGFGQAMLDFLVSLSSRSQLPQVLSLSLGSLSARSCNMLCHKAADKGIAPDDCKKFIQQQRQVCMFMSEAEQTRINLALKLLGARGVTVFGSSGDGGSHFSFQKFEGGQIADVLNQVSCEYQLPVFPSSSPYIVSVGGTVGSGLFRPNLSKPKAWEGSGGGFSWLFEAPAHQADAIRQYLSTAPDLPPSSSYNKTGRAYPDISALAVEGTSQSSPIVAGIFSLLTDARLNQGLPPLGYLGPRLYTSYASHPHKGWTDVTSGSSATSCSNGFTSQQGWDPVTGLGQPIWQDLLQLFGSDRLATRS